MPAEGGEREKKRRKVGEGREKESGRRGKNPHKRAKSQRPKKGRVS